MINDRKTVHRSPLTVIMKRSTLIVLLATIALGAFVYFYEMKAGKGRDEEQAIKPAFTFKSEEVTFINLTHKGQTVALEKNGLGWTITQPVKADADQATIDTLVSSVTSATIERSMIMTESLQRGSGLAQPDVTVELKLKNGEQHKVVLGKKDPTDASVYAAVDQDKNVLLLPATILTNASKTLTDLRSKDIAKLSPDDLTSFKIKNQNLTFEAEKNTEAKWLVKEPANKKGKDANTTKIFSVFSTQATEIIDSPDEKIKALLAQPVVEAEFSTKDNKAIKLYISKVEGENVYVRIDGKSEIYKTGKSLVDSLNFKLADVSTEPTPAPKAEATEGKKGEKANDQN